MLARKMLQALNRQVNRELYSAYLYLSMSAYFEARELRGLAQWLMVQAREEWQHAAKMYQYIVSRRGRAQMMKIEAPPKAWPSPLAAFEHVARHEKKVSALIAALVKTARAARDRQSEEFLQWYVKEQEEEEENAARAVQKLKWAKGRRETIAAVDSEMGRRQ